MLQVLDFHAELTKMCSNAPAFIFLKIQTRSLCTRSLDCDRRGSLHSPAKLGVNSVRQNTMCHGWYDHGGVLVTGKKLDISKLFNRSGLTRIKPTHTPYHRCSVVTPFGKHVPPGAQQIVKLPRPQPQRQNSWPLRQPPESVCNYFDIAPMLRVILRLEDVFWRQRYRKLIKLLCNVTIITLRVFI